MGPYTRQDGIWGYLEILQAFNNDTLINLPGAQPHGWTTVTDDCYDAPYAYNGPYWISYDDEESVALKTQYANLLGLFFFFFGGYDIFIVIEIMQYQDNIKCTH